MSLRIEHAGGIVEWSHSGRCIITSVRSWRFLGRSPYQEIAIGEVDYLGTCLFLDGWLQLAQADEHIYHEHLVLPALLAHGHPARVLILGGGDGLAVREALRHTRVEAVTVVDIDELVVTACQQHLAHLQHGALADPRVRVIIQDAREYLRTAPEGYDVILVDLVDFLLETQGLFQDTILTAGHLLNPGGILVSHGPDPGPPMYEGLRMVNLLTSTFPHVAWYTAGVGSFTEPWCFALASHDVIPQKIPLEDWVARSQALTSPPRSFSPHQFPGAFYHGTEVETVLSQLRRGDDGIPPMEAWPACRLDGSAMSRVTKVIACR